MPRFVEIVAILAFLLLSAPIVAGLATIIFAATYSMIFTEVPLEEARALAPFFLTVAAFVYGTLYWHVLKKAASPSSGHLWDRKGPRVAPVLIRNRRRFR